jgi:hypothetical protein
MLEGGAAATPGEVEAELPSPVEEGPFELLAWSVMTALFLCARAERALDAPYSEWTGSEVNIRDFAGRALDPFMWLKERRFSDPVPWENEAFTRD